MKTCTCGWTLADNASECSTCGRKYTTSTVWIFGLLLPILGLGLIAYSCASNF